MNLIQYMKAHSQVDRSSRYRDRRGHYASSALSCPRDMYWALTGVPKTNPIDFLGKMKMLVGSGVEQQLIKEYFSDMHWYGVHMVGTQAQVGGSNPMWDGNMDVVLAQRNGDTFEKPFVVEIKTKSGYGADLLWASCEPSLEYMAQLGLYLRHLDSKGVTNNGCLFYVLLSDKNFGECLQIDCHFESATNTVYATKATNSKGIVRDLESKLSLDFALDNFRKVDRAVAEGIPPAPTFKYKHELTEELLQKLSDDKLRKMYRGELVVGDWQARYSSWLDHNCKIDQVSRVYTEKERASIRSEYLSRHPNSKM